MTIPSKWFTESTRKTMIDFFTNKLNEEVDLLSRTPSSEDILYHTAICRANIAWYKAMLHVADPIEYKNNPIGPRVKHSLTAREYDEWMKEMLERLTKSPPHQDFVMATYIHKLINNGVEYNVK